MKDGNGEVWQRKTYEKLGKNIYFSSASVFFELH